LRRHGCYTRVLAGRRGRPGGVSSALGRALHEKGARVESFESLKKLILEAEEDVKKAEGGNKAAGTRARQLMQDIKNMAQEVREKILEIRDASDKK
jgi:hypothetical protein